MKEKIPADEQHAAMQSMVDSKPQDIDELVQQHPRASSANGNTTRKRAMRSADSNPKDVRELQRMIDSGMQYKEIMEQQSYHACKRTLNHQQQQFMLALIDGKTLTTAYRIAYSPPQERPDRSVFKDAFKLAQHPIIVLEMRKAIDKLKEHRVINAQAIRNHVINGLLKESEHAETASARVRAYELLGKLAEVGMFVDRKEVKHITNDPEEMKKQLVDKLRQYFGVTREAAEEVKLIEETKNTTNKDT